MKCAALLGANWDNGSNAGSRASNWNNAPWNSNNNIGARGRSDGQSPARRRSRPRRPITNGGQPDRPASANTLRGSAERGVAHRNPRPAILMGKKYRNLMPRIVADDNMRLAYRRTALGRRMTYGALEFKEHAEVNLARLAEQIEAGCFSPDPAKHFTVFEPKPRAITALSFRDRVAHHALIAVIGPIFEATLLPRTFACRSGLGTHAGVRAVQAELRRLGPDAWFLKTDFSKFFASIDRARLWRMIEAKISCGQTLDFIGRVVSPTGRGLPIGALTSQIFANVYAGAVDRLLAQRLGEKLWFRYMDDIVVLGVDPGRLRCVKDEIEAFAAADLGLSFSKWSVAPVGRGVNFLGYRIWATHKLLRRQSVIGAKRKIRRFRAVGDLAGLSAFVGAWGGHAAHADSRHLLVKLGLET